MTVVDVLALVLFVVTWVGVEPWIASQRRVNSVPLSMEVIRRAWMREVLTRDTNFIGDAAILGHTINSASFFASANLIVIMGVVGTLFVDPDSIAKVGLFSALSVGKLAWLFQFKIIIILATLLRGLSDFVWAVRQLNYCLAAIGSSPARTEDRNLDGWVDALTSIANPALKTFSKGVRSYYYTFAAMTWFLGPWVFGAGTVLATGLLVWRHTSSETARGLERITRLLEQEKR